MKLIVLGVVLIWSGSVYATPAVGDVATYDETLVRADGQSATGTQTLQIMSFDPAANTYDIKKTTILGAQTTIENNNVSADVLLTDSQITSAIDSCEVLGGVSQKIAIAGGSKIIGTCKISYTMNGTAWMNWIAPVPLGYAKKVEADPSGTVTTLVLNSYSPGPAK